MFFKRIELSGFKSFGAKTALDFQPGVTVIVGPNGCGKSNVLDSIRWVLGEQNPRHLRGGRMSDVIFSGTSSLKAQGMAQVSLTLNNQDGRLPIDFSEVNVTRRLFADGQSEYLINKSACRRKDIVDLFMDTGAGSIGYSIMEQGKIDTIINAKPKDRRQIFEEAAGISKYRARRAEALRKLERADADFIRLTDLIAEVRRQTNSLKRQASRAERYKRFSEEAKLLQRKLLLLRYEQMQQKLAEAKRAHASFQDQLAALSTRIADLEAAQEKSHSDEGALLAEISRKNAEKFEISRQIEQREHAITLLRERIADGEKRREEIGLQGEAAAREELEIAVELGRARLDLESNQLLLAEALGHYDETKSEYDEMRSGLEGANERLNALRERLHNLREEKATAENAVQISRALIQRLDEQIAAGDQDSEELRLGVQALQSRADELERRRDETSKSLAERRAEQETLKKANAEASSQSDGLNRQIAEIQRRLGEAQSKLKAFEDIEASYQGYYQGVRSAMQAGDEGRLKGLIGVVAHLARTPAEFETAIEAALGGHLQDIVSRTAEDAKAAVQYLKEKRLGRATFQPLDLLIVQQPNSSFLDALKRAGVIGAAADLIEYDPEVASAIKFLLGRTIVVQDLDLAISLEREGLRQRYVSLDGQIVQPSGSITGGDMKSSGLLSREREIRELRETVAQCHSELRSFEEKAESLRAALAEGQRRAIEINEQIQRLEVTQAELARDADSCRANLAEKRQAFEEYDSRRQKWLDEIHSHKLTIDEKEDNAGELAARTRECEAELADAQNEMSAQDTQIDAVAAALSDMRVEMAQTKERIERQSSNCRRLTARQWALSHGYTGRRRRLTELDLRRQEAESEISRTRETLRDLFEERRQAESAVADLEQGRIELSRKINERTQILHSSQSDRNGLQNETHEADLRRNEIGVELNHLREQSRENFQCEIDELTPPEEEEGAGGEPVDADALYAQLVELKGKLDSMGIVNLGALEEYEETSKRLDFLQGQETDLTEARRQLTETISEIDETTKKMFQAAFEAIRENFINMFRQLFGGGRADLILLDDEENDPLLEGGVEIVAQPPGKKPQTISLLSGGEKALTAIALLFGIFQHRPSPFCVLDEIDAPLDDANIERFKNLLLEFGEKTQFIIITHSKQTMTLADSIYGITMEEAGVSKIVSVRFDDKRLSLTG
jgi:chromosome segregation protein